MYRIAYAILHDEGQAEDAVMTAFEGVARAGRVPRDPSSKDAERLAFTSVRNAAIDQYRKNARERERFQPLGDGEHTIADDPADEPERAMIAQAGFESLVDPLPEQLQGVLHERFVNGSSVREAANNLGISEASVRKRQQRAIERIRSLKGTANDQQE